ncbi:hypothetical protein [Sphaerochaeta sp.]|uniref:hypothetical protein n=1 Tax=Sphaerochaeta sp. TaxID=1972642 RepID=UPI003D0FB8CA
MTIDTIFSLMRNPWVLTLLLALAGLLGISVQSSRLKKAKQKVEDEKAHAEYEKRLRQQQQQLVADSEKAKEEYSDEKDEAVGSVVPEMEKAKAVPKDKQKPLGEDVKTMAKAQAERIAKRRAKK